MKTLRPLIGRRFQVILTLLTLLSAGGSRAFYMETGLPLYVYPSAGQTDWATAISAGGSQVGFIIANVSDGPGTTFNSDWDRVISDATANGIQMHGYVYSGYGLRPGADVDADIATWLRLYPKISGFFIDEAASDSANLPYYQARYNYIKSLNPNLTVVINPGVYPVEGYMTACDVNTVYEDYASNWSADVVPAWVFNYPESRFYGFVKSCATQEEMQSIVASAKTRNFGAIYISDSSTASAHLPSYFQAELSAIDSQRDSNTPPPLSFTATPAVSAARTSATVSWQTSISSVGTVVFGLSPSSLKFQVLDGTASTSHAVQINGLSRKTTYYYQVIAQTPDGSQSISSQVGSFRTRP